jgi:anaerobic magnesium-protoporphyrin IX monomethyl ester cyclase
LGDDAVAGPDVLFVNLPPHESYYADGVPHLGMLYVLTSLREHGYAAGYLDCAQRGTRRDDVLRLIRESNPRMVGFSVDTDNLYNIAGFTRYVRESLGATVPIILGGPASQSQAEQMIALSAADVVVIGEGEYSACEVADALLRGKGRLEDVAGICYRGADGRPRRTGDRDPIEDLDALPFPDRGFLPDDRRYEVCLISGRGCPFRCTFCFEGRMGNTYRHRSAANLVAEIEQLVER